MTVVTRLLNAMPDAKQDAKLSNVSGSWKWANMTDGAIAFVAGEFYVARFPLDVPQGATITLAQFVFEYTQKDATVAQTANFSLYFEQADNSAPWPYVTDTVMTSPSPPTFPGGRAIGAAQNFVISYPGGSTPGADLVTQTVTSQIQALVNRAGWEAGNYVTLAMLCTAEGSPSDMSIQTREGNSSPVLKITHSYNDDTVARSDVNLLLNQTLANTLEVLNNSMFGLTMDNTAYTTVNQGRDGGPCLQVIAHPPAGQENRLCAAIQFYSGTGDETYVLSGWFYNPGWAADFSPDFVFLGGRTTWQQKNRWTPFATLPTKVATGGGPLWCAFYLDGSVSGKNVTDGMWFLLDDLCLTRTTVQEMPWTGATPDKFNTDYEPKESVTHGVSVRRSRARTHVLVSGVSTPRRNFVRNELGLWVRADQARTITYANSGGPTWDTAGTSTTTWDTVG